MFISYPLTYTPKILRSITTEIFALLWVSNISSYDHTHKDSRIIELYRSSEQSEGILLVLIRDKLIRICRETEVVRRDDDL